MRIAIIGKLLAPIRTTSAMGQEKFTYNLAHLLAKRGHEVTLFTSSDSKVEGVKIVPVIKKSYWTASKKIPKEKISLNLGRMYATRESIGYLKTLYYLRSHKHDFDIVHDNTDEYGIIGLHKFLVNLPLVSTVHVPPKYLQNLNNFISYQELDNYYIAISKKQKKMVRNARVFDIIYNGIDTRKFSYSEKPLNYLGWIGRLDPNKGLGAAIEVATKTKSKLRIAGPIQNQKYFDEEIKPKLGKNIKYLGPLSGRKLVRFYKKSKAILFPIRWEEPFGLVMAEAMSCGTPIIAFRRGSVPEIVVQGKTGFICPKDKTSSMVKAVEKINSMNKKQYVHIRENCRKHVEENFTLARMVDNYEKVYQKIINDWKEKNK